MYILRTFITSPLCILTRVLIFQMKISFLVYLLPLCSKKKQIKSYKSQLYLLVLRSLNNKLVYNREISLNHRTCMYRVSTVLKFDSVDRRNLILISCPMISFVFEFNDRHTEADIYLYISLQDKTPSIPNV